MRHRSAQINRFALTLRDVTDFPQLMWEARPFHATQPGVSPTDLHSAPSPPPKPRQALSSHIDVHAQRETTIQRDPPAPGWPELYRTVREADVSKVEDCREDIDTLLVFAGLYSAVLTAFVIESYTHLQQDPQDVIIGLLQQIATQNFISGPGFVNSTTTATAPPPFEPPLWAIRVNVLWFTSLLLSLISASFGILVKQWLREYLAIEYTVPQQRLRARQYRNPGLAQWRVFEIAAFLPLLLQLSLGLFFLGLCFFTAAVHNSVGRTTTPLIAAWAFLLLITTIAPLFSPRCPFKTTFLKRSLKHTRRYVSLVVRCFTPPMRSIARHIGTAVSACLGAVRPGDGWYFRRLSRAADWIETVRSPWARYPATGALIVVAIPYFVKTKGTKMLVRQAAKVPAAAEEEEFVKTEGNDVEILLSVDAVMPDDGLLPTMLDVVRQQAGDEPGKVVHFITHLIARRNDLPLDGARIPSLSGTPPLSTFAWAAISDAIADSLATRGSEPLGLDAASTRDWIHSVIVILNSHPSHHLSDRAIRGIGQVRLVPMRMPGHECSGGVPLSRCLPELGVAWVNAEPMCLRCISDVYRTLLCTPQELASNDVSLRHILDARAPDDAFVASSIGLLHSLFAAMTRFMAKAAADFPTEMRGFDEAVHIVLQYGERFGGQGSVGRLCCRMLLTEPGARAILIHLSALHPQCRVKTDRTEIPLEGNTWDDNPRIQAHLNAACEWLSENDTGVPLDYVRLCAISYMWVDSALLAQAVEKYHRAQGWKTELAQREYWFDSATPSSPTPEERFRDDQVMAYDVIQNHHGFMSLDLVDALWPFVPEERREQLLRLICKKRAYVPRALGVGDGGDGDGERETGGGGGGAADAVRDELGDAETSEAFSEKASATGRELGGAGKNNVVGESGASEVPGTLEIR